MARDSYSMNSSTSADAEYLRSVVETIVDGIITVDDAGMICSFNRAAENIFGYHSSEIVGQNVKLLMPDLESHTYASYAEDPGNGWTISAAGKLEGQRKDGSTFPVELAVGEFKLKGSRMFTGVIRDITQRDRAEVALRESEHRFRQLAENIGEVLWIADGSGETIQYVSPAYEHIWGRSCQSIYENSTSWLDAIHVDDRQRVADSWWNNAAKGDYKERFRIVRPDGSIRWIHDRGMPIRDDAGQVYRIVGIAEDITERMQAEQRITESVKKYESLLHNTPVAVYSTVPDETGTIIFVSERWCEWTGHSADDLYQDPDIWAKSIHPDDRERAMTSSAEACKSTKEYVCDYRIIHKDSGKVRHVSDRRAPITEVNGEIIRLDGIITDTSKRREAEEKVQLYQSRQRLLGARLAQAEESERRRIAGGLHDQVAQELAIAKMRLSEVRRSMPSNKLAAALKQAIRSVDNSIQAIRLLTFELASPVLYELGLEPALQSLADDFEKQHHITCIFNDDGNSKPLSDQIRATLYRAVGELLVNIVKYARAEHVMIAVKRNGQIIRCQITDDGIGFDVTDTGFRHTKAGGFGLFNINERLDFLGGNLEIKSTPGVGTEVTLTAPLEKEK